MKLINSLLKNKPFLLQSVGFSPNIKLKPFSTSKVSKLHSHKSLYESLLEKYSTSTAFINPKLFYNSYEETLKNPYDINLTLNNSYSDFSLNIISKSHSDLLSKVQKTFREKEITLKSLLQSNNDLQTLIDALWQIYQSNNLRLSQSFFRLINSVTTADFDFRELYPIYRSSMRILYMTKYISLIKKLQPIADITRRVMSIRNVISVRKTLPKETVFTEVSTIGRKKLLYSTFQLVKVLNKLPIQKSILLNKHISQSRINEFLFTERTFSPMLEKIYEGIESNILFYNSNVYKSEKTLYRLTNSLWKVYNNQNLELSRSFTRLIHTVTEKDTLHKKTYFASTFSSPQSLANLVMALRRAFSGNNLFLRHSLISLVQDIHSAGNKQSTTTKIKKTTQTSKNYDNSFLYLFNLFKPYEIRRALTNMYHPVYRQQNIEGFSKNDAEKLIAKKLQNIDKQTVEKQISPEALINAVTQRIKKEQQEEWRYEKIQRGIL